MSSRTMDDGRAVAPDIGAAPPGSVARDVACRVLDLVLGAVMLIVTLPLFALIAIAIRLDTRGPILFRQHRVGRHQRRFTINKFRTMERGADPAVHRDYVLSLITAAAPAPKLVGDARVTRVGRFLRRTSLDELPQLLNVIGGTMSLVGPRPPIPYEVTNYPSHWFVRFLVKPGITGLWQVSGRSQVSLEEMIAMDADYVTRRSVWLNLAILIRTVPAVLTARGAG